MTGVIKGEEYYYSEQQQGIDRRLKALIIQRCVKFLQGPRVLDLGFVDGDWTDVVLQRGWNCDIVEGAKRHVDYACKLYSDRSDVRIFHAKFELFEAPCQYDSIIAGDILRYLRDSSAFLQKLRGLLNPGGRLIVTVPNSRSLHRRIGTLLGIEAHPTDANARDIEVGNLRSYDRYELRRELQLADLKIIELRGSFLKPLSSTQMADWDDNLLNAYLEIGDELEDYAWFIYAICEA